MYENIRKPGLLKNIPLLIIRALPSLYYFGKFGSKYNNAGCEQLFLENLDYLKHALKLMYSQMNTNSLDQTIKILDHMDTSPIQDILPTIERLTTDLSDHCNANIQECRNFYKENKQKLIDLYRENVTPLHVLVTDMQTDQRLPHLLCDVCYYDVQHARIKSDDFSTKLGANDFVILTNLNTSDIHSQIEQIDSFQKPAMVVTGIDDSTSANKTAIRHAMQLIRRGFPVIFKIFTPIRLFTSVEKTFFKYYARPLVV